MQYLSPSPEFNFSTAQFQSRAAQLYVQAEPIIVAHQGVQGVFPANSFEAISAAFGVAKSVEFDTYAVPLADNPEKKEVIIIHPEGYFFYVDRKGMQNHAQLPVGFEEIRKVQVDGRSLVPTLQELLERYYDRSAQCGVRSELQIELKGPGTAEVVVPLLQKEIASGKLTYDDFILCAFCYEGEEKSRLEIARSLDSKVQLCLSVRGGDFSQDAFKNYQEVFEYAKKHNITWLDITRRNLTPAIVSEIKRNGFHLSCHHCRTTDELECARALRVDSIRADMFLCPESKNYPGYAEVDTPEIFERLYKQGIFRMRDWIWEFSKEISQDLESQAKQILDVSSNVDRSVQEKAQLLCDQSGRIVIKPCFAGEVSNYTFDFSNRIVPSAYLSDLERQSSKGLTLRELLSKESVALSISNALKALGDPLGDRKVTFDDWSALLEFKDMPDHARLSMSVARAFFVRAGRMLGSLSAVALRPLQNERSDYSISIQSPLCNSELIRNFAAEQAKAQALRNGNDCHVRSYV